MYEVLTTPGTTIPLVFATVCLVAWFSRRRSSRIPPGPPLTPFVGNLPLIYNNDKQKVFRSLREKYGDIFSLYIGNQLVVVLNGYEAIRDAFVKKADVFSDRPPGVRMMDGKTRGIVATSGSLWKEHRKFALVTLRDFGFGKFSLESTIQDEVRTFLDEIATRQKDCFDVKNIIQNSISNVICSIAFGKRFHYDDPVFTDLMQTFELVIQQSKVGPFLGVLKFFDYLPGDLAGRKVEMASVARYREFAQSIYKEHLATYDENNIRDYIDAYIHQMRKEDKDYTTFTECQLYGEIMDLFQAGTETTATTIRWALLYLINHPDVQNKMRSEIDEVVGMNRLPSMEDKKHLPYSEAVITEVLRIGNIAPTAVPHYTSSDVMLNGFFIPKSTMVLANIDSVLSDATVWKNPYEFQPERFINQNGSVEKRNEFIPFSSGRRICLGESLARMELFLFLTSMIQRFVFLPQDSGSAISTEGITGLTHSPRPYKFRVQDLLNETKKS